ncbi:glutenin, high molecular weight subunit PW212-like isoform X2 [Amblyraja radiata]|uniref:glutenin, high molecular weight subunit PW212-like isoform X2 n=1 Tax=Amblyraja radiata TaxID=386614 RepID=UPI001401EA56|nr:glutenin, high molecular weight subunit PW212-like isoform X2 [Amblyraja radiata]
MNFVGLNNQGSTCYLNTLLQTWFMTPEFKDCISRSQTQDRLIDELKNLFEQLARENYHSVCTKSLTSYLGLNVYKQCDIEVCFRSLMSKLSTKMDKENNILKIYQVTMVHSMMCSKCMIPLDKENLFLDIPLSMCSANSLEKFKCMENSLRAFLDVEKMEGDNKCYCDVCGEKTESTSRYYFKNLPQILTFQLKRFEFDCYCMRYRKIEDYISLPSDLVFKKSKKKDMENREISVDNIDVQEQLKIKEEVLTSIQGDESPGHPGIYPRLPSEASNAQNNHSLEAMERGQSETSPLQGQEKYSVNDEGKMAEAAPGQSEQDSTVDKKKDMENREISVDNIDVQRQLKIEEKLLTSIQGDESPGHPGIYPRLPSEESNAQNNHSLEAMERGQSETSPLQGQEESSVNGEGKMTEAAPGQSEQDSTVDKDDYNEWCPTLPENKEQLGSQKRRHDTMEEGQGSVPTQQFQGGTSKDCGGRSEEAQDQSEQDSTQQKLKKPKMLNTASNAQNNHSLEAMERGQSETSPLQGQEKYSVNDEGRMTEAAPGQSEQDSTVDKKKDMENREISVYNIDVQRQLKIEEKLLTSIQVDESPGHPGIYPRLPSEESNAQNNHSLEAMERGQSETSPLQGQEESSVNGEGKMTEAAPGQSEQDSTVDKKKDMENREISVDNIDVQEQLKIEEKLLTSIQVDESPGHPGIYPRLPSEESNAQNNHSLEAMERGQSETSPLQGQEESSVNGEGKMTEAAPGQSEQDSTVDKENNSGNNHIFTAVERGQGDLSTLQAKVILKEEYSVNDEERPTEAEGQSEQDSTEDKENHSPSKCFAEVPEGEQSSTPTLQGQNGNSENCEGGTSWTVQDQSEQVSTEDKENHSPSKCCVEVTEGEQSSTPTLQGQNGNSENCEGGTSWTFQDQSEQVSPEDKENHSPSKCFAEVTEGEQSSTPTLQGQNGNSENCEGGTSWTFQDQSEQVSPEDKENHSPSKCFAEVTEGEQSSTPTLQGQNGNSENCEGGTSWTFQDQSEQVSPEDKVKKYELFAIWHHFGSYGSGHYIAEIKSGSGDWYSFDDRFVEKIGKNTKRRSTSAYMVMYRLVDTNKEAARV